MYLIHKVPMLLCPTYHKGLLLQCWPPAKQYLDLFSNMREPLGMGLCAHHAHHTAMGQCLLHPGWGKGGILHLVRHTEQLSSQTEQQKMKCSGASFLILMHSLLIETVNQQRNK